MAKTSKPRLDPAENLRSRASKRATSPSIDVDKSLKDTPRASDATPVLGVSRNSGIQKSKPKQKQMTRGQRARQEKLLARAEAVQDQYEKKIESAKSRGKKRQARKGTWDDTNKTSKDETRKAIHVLGRLDDTKDDDDWEDDVEPYHGDIEMQAVGNVQATTDTIAVPLVLTKSTPSQADLTAEDDHDNIS